MIHHKSLVGDRHGVGRIVRVHDCADAVLVGEPVDHVENQNLIVKIKTCLRLVENDQLRFIDQCARNQYHLKFSAAHAVAVLFGKMRDACFLHHGFRHLNLPSAGLFKNTKMRTAAEHDHFQSGVGKSKTVALRNVGDIAPQFLWF